MPDNRYSIRAKDFCNCEHAQALLQAILDAYKQISDGWPNEGMAVLAQAIMAHDKAHKEYSNV